MRKAFVVGAVLFALSAAAVLGQTPAAPPAAVQAQTGAADAAHKVTFSRPSAVGDAYKLSIDFKMRSEGGVGFGGDNMGGGAQEQSATLQGSVRVLEVNAAGEATKLMVHVDKAESSTGKETKPMKIAGADLGIAFPFNQTRIVRRDGQPLDKGEEMFLTQVFQPPTGITPDDYMNPGKDVKPGDSWPLKKDVMAKLLSGPIPEAKEAKDSKDAKDQKKGLDPSKLDGSVTYVGVETWSGLPCDHFTMQVSIRNLEQPRFVGDLQMDIKVDQLLPQDVKVKKSKETTEFSSSVRGKYVSEDGKTLDVRSKNKITTVSAVQ